MHTSVKCKKNYLIIILYFFLAFFPYISIVNLGTDTQPYALVMSLILILVLPIFRFQRFFLILLIPFVFSLLLGVASGFSYNSIRSIANYASLFFISMSTYSILKLMNGFPTKYLRISIWIWFIVGLLQFVLNRNLFTELVRNARTSVSRGVTALAPEPSYYGITCLFFLLLVNLTEIDERIRNRLAFLLIIQIVFFAQSSMVVVFLIIFLLLYFLSHLSLRNVIIGTVSSTVTILLFMFFIYPRIKDVRVIQLVGQIIMNPFMIIFMDQSVNDRFFNVFFSIYGFFRNYLIPNGFDRWQSFVLESQTQYSAYIINVTAGRIMSGYGSALFELGIIGLLIPVAITKAINDYFSKNKQKKIQYCVFVNMILLSAIPLALPIIGVLIGYLRYDMEKRRHLVEISI